MAVKHKNGGEKIMVLVGTGTMSYEIQFREIQSRPIDCHRKL